jgi:hypothetical protein
MSADRRASKLQIYNETNDRVIFPVGNQTGNLVELITKAIPDNDFDLTHTYNIVFTFDDDDDPTNINELTITINGWELHIQDGEVLE